MKMNNFSKYLILTLLLTLCFSRTFADGDHGVKRGGHSGGGCFTTEELATVQKIKEFEMSVKRILPIFFNALESEYFSQELRDFNTNSWFAENLDPDYIKKEKAKDAIESMKKFSAKFEMAKVLFNKHHPRAVRTNDDNTIFEAINKFNGFYLPASGQCYDEVGQPKDAFYKSPEPGKVCISLKAVHEKNIIAEVLLSRLVYMTGHELVHQLDKTHRGDRVADIVQKFILENWQSLNYYKNVVFRFILDSSKQQKTISNYIQMINDGESRQNVCRKIGVSLINGSIDIWNNYLTDSMDYGYSLLSPVEQYKFTNSIMFYAFNIFRVCDVDDFPLDLADKMTEQEKEEFKMTYQRVRNAPAGPLTLSASTIIWGDRTEYEEQVAGYPINNINLSRSIVNHDIQDFKKFLLEYSSELNNFKNEAASRIGEVISSQFNGTPQEIMESIEGYASDYVKRLSGQCSITAHFLQSKDSYASTSSLTYVPHVCDKDSINIRTRDAYDITYLVSTTADDSTEACRVLSYTFLEKLAGNIRSNASPQIDEVEE